MFADVIVDIASGELDRTFQYRVPAGMEDRIVPGVRVSIPFGRGSRMIEGYVIRTDSRASYPEEKIKDIEGIVPGGVSVESQLITLAADMRTVYGSTMAAALKTVIPVKRQVRPKTHKSYTLGIPRAEALALLQDLEKDKRRSSAATLLRALLVQDSLSAMAVTQNLGVSVSVIKNLRDRGVITEEISRVYRKPVCAGLAEDTCAGLSDEQIAAVRGILEKPGEVHLLHGVTGSGKTEVYMALAGAMLSEGKQVIVLIPEISLTLQTVSRFYRKFGDRVSVMNSRLTAGERYDQFMRAREGDVDIIVGPRSALFMPFERLGMIIIDEEHDGAYKSETAPRYHAREAAVWRSKLCGATVVLGSATPSVVTYAKARAGIYHLHRLTRRVSGEMADVHVVDLREEFKLKNRNIFSGRLSALIADRLEKGEQVMLFLNRRGYAGFVSCRNCGYVVKCRHCDVSLTAHSDGRLKCHYCGYEQPIPRICPHCGSKYIGAFGTGTQKVERMAAELFPGARVLRMDRDTTAKKGSIDTILTDFKNGNADILVGTQMIVKGHDFPRVTLVGVLAADLTLFSGDYLAAERTFQLLVQAAGRAGRGSLRGEVVIQTYQPDHYCITAAAAQDYERFYDQEIAYRQMMHYPPFAHVMAVLGEAYEEAELGEAMAHIQEMTRDIPEMEVIGPAAAAMSRARDAYRQVIYFKCGKMRPLIGVKRQIERDVSENPLFKKVYVQFDMDPMNLF